MTIARSHLIDPSLTRWYHCVTRCVRRAHLLGDEKHNRKEWIENRLEELGGCFAVSVGGFSVMNNHLHVLFVSTRTSPRVGRMRTSSGAGEGSARRGIQMHAGVASHRRMDPVAAQGRSVGGTGTRRLQSVSWFMKYLKEPLRGWRIGKTTRRACRGFGRGRRRGRFAVALSDRGPTRARLSTRRDDCRLAAGELCSARRLHRAALPAGKGQDFGGAGRNPGTAWGQCPNLASPDEEVAKWPVVRPILCHQSGEAAADRRSPPPEIRGESRQVSGPMNGF